MILEFLKKIKPIIVIRFQNYYFQGPCLLENTDLDGKLKPLPGFEEKKMDEKKKSCLRPRCKIAVKKWVKKIQAAAHNGASALIKSLLSVLIKMGLKLGGTFKTSKLSHFYVQYLVKKIHYK